MLELILMNCGLAWDCLADFKQAMTNLLRIFVKDRFLEYVWVNKAYGLKKGMKFL